MEEKEEEEANNPMLVGGVRGGGAEWVAPLLESLLTCGGCSVPVRLWRTERQSPGGRWTSLMPWRRSGTGMPGTLLVRREGEKEGGREGGRCTPDHLMSLLSLSET